MRGDGWFRTPVTRPLRWALPLAVAGWIVLFVVPTVAAATGPGGGCLGDDWRSVARDGDRIVVDVGRDLDDCIDRRRAAFVASSALFGLAQLPLVFFVVRGFVWGANTLHDLAHGAPTSG